MVIPHPDDATISVLHVDDDPQFGSLLVSYLERLEDDMTVTFKSSPETVLSTIETDDIDCIVSDFQMPQMDGIELLKAVRQEYPNLPFFLCTARGSEEVVSQAIHAGVTSYLQKGGTEVFEQLAHRIRNAVTKRNAERRAEVARDRILELYEQTDGFFIVGSEWKMTYWNQRIADRTGRSPGEVLGQHFLEALPDAHDTEFYRGCKTCMTEREPVSFETHYEPDDDWLDVNIYPVDEGLFVHTRKITAEKERELELTQRNEVLESFANTVSHDLRNPLSGAEGNLRLAQESGDFDHLDEVAQAHNRMRNLINELLQFARGDDQPSTPVSLRKVTTEAWKTVIAENTSLEVDREQTILAVETQLRRLLENVFWNAIEHGNASVISVGPLDEDGFYVQDDGSGIPPAERESVFEAGYSTIEGNPGYGLHIVERICNTHGWSIRITDGDLGGRPFRDCRRRIPGDVNWPRSRINNERTLARWSQSNPSFLFMRYFCKPLVASGINAH